jgi:hypothetical protein
MDPAYPRICLGDLDVRLSDFFNKFANYFVISTSHVKKALFRNKDWGLCLFSISNCNSEPLLLLTYEEYVNALIADEIAYISS